MTEEAANTPQRWTVKRRATLVLSIVKGETSAQAAARKHGLTVAEIEEWRDRFLLAAENALRARPKDGRHWYNTERPHQALGSRSPTEWPTQQLTQVA